MGSVIYWGLAIGYCVAQFYWIKWMCDRMHEIGYRRGRLEATIEAQERLEKIFERLRQRNEVKDV